MPIMSVLEAALQAPSGIALLPTEDTLLLAVELPTMSASQRRAVVGFAVEDRIAQSLDAVQVVLGPQLTPGVWLVAVTARSVLDEITIDKAGAALWPDVLMVPVPGSGWAVWAAAGRILVRLPDGTGIATQSGVFQAFWTAAGSPDVTLYGGGALPPEIPISARGDLPRAPSPFPKDFDLRAGLNRRRGNFLPKGGRSLLMVVVVAALAHVSLLVADVMALNRQAGQREVELRAILNTPAGGDLEVALEQALKSRQPGNGNGGVLILLTQTFAALQPENGRVSVQKLRYAATANEAVLNVEAPDLATLQSVQTALSAAGLTVTTGAATNSDGAAEVQMTIRDGSA